MLKWIWSLRFYNKNVNKSQKIWTKAASQAVLPPLKKIAPSREWQTVSRIFLPRDAMLRAVGNTDIVYVRASDCLIDSVLHFI